MTQPNNEQLEKIRHSLSHIMTAAIMERWPKVKLGVGPAIENGFYQDYGLPEKISDEDLPSIEKRMKEIIRQKLAFEQELMAKKDALNFYRDDPFKTELVNEFYPDESEQVQFYKIGGSRQLCRGGHLDNTGDIDSDSFKLVSVAGAYWRGDENNQMLTRIYGLAFATKDELEKHLALLKEAKERDHRKFGKELDLFTFSELVGAGLPLWTPKGTIIRTELDNFIWQLRQQYGYQKVTVPHLTKKELYEKSGHWKNYQDDLFKVSSREEHQYAIKPMNCPHHTQIFARKIQSYRDMPQRYAETTMVYRDEQSGELNGLSRVLCITQDDAHVFCRKNQIADEVGKIWNIVNSFYGAFNLPLCIRLSLHDPKHPENYLGDEDNWQMAENELRKVIQSRQSTCTEAPGEAAFYGPKIDFMATDSLQRVWQVATIQLDFNMPERFDLSCISENGQHERIVMLHAAITGSLERFISVMLEHCNGNLPLWCSPVQIKLLTINDKQFEPAKKLLTDWQAQGIRAELDETNDTLGNKIRRAVSEKIPYVIVLGDKEIQSQSLSVRVRGQDTASTVKQQEFVTQLQEKIKQRSLEL